MAALAAGLTSCVTARAGFNPGGPEDWPDTYQDMARWAWVYAQMAQNAYDDPATTYALPDSIHLAGGPVHEPATGFGASVYEVHTRGTAGRDSVGEVVIAFRGTDFSERADWDHGNFGWGQNDRAEQFFAETRARYPSRTRIIVAGHSLGGALALQVSTRNDSIEAYVFNSSYHIRNSLDAPGDRWSIAERREIVGVVRGVLKNPTIVHHPYFTCQEGGNPVSRHKMVALAWCITRVAAFTDPGARASIDRNRVIGEMVEGMIDTVPMSPDSMAVGLHRTDERPLRGRSRH